MSIVSIAGMTCIYNHALPSKGPLVKKLTLLIASLAAWLVAAGPASGLTLNPFAEQTAPDLVAAFAAQVKSYSAAVTTFKDMYQAVPGDMHNAGMRLLHCGDTGSACDPAPGSDGNSIIGNPDFIKTLKPQVTGKTRVPAVSAADETILFWAHLLRAQLITGVTDAGTINGSVISFGTVLPASKLGGGFIVGYGDGSALPSSLSPLSAGMKGTLLVLLSDAALMENAELNAPGQQPLTPALAAAIDRKMDDGRPATGYIQAYGAPGCFAKDDVAYAYAEANAGKDCGLVFRIGE